MRVNSLVKEVAAWFVVAAIALMLGTRVFAYRQKVARLATTESNLCLIQTKLWQWNVDHEPDPWVTVFWTAPDLAPVAAAESNGWPINPYSGLPMHELKPGEPNRTGDFRYLSRLEHLTMADGTKRDEHVDYRLVLYLPAGAKRLGDSRFSGRLGHEPQLVLEEGTDCRKGPGPREPHLTVAESNEETWDDALTRQGY